MLRIYNSLSRAVDDFEPINPPKVGMYTCGPTVYWNQHIGHMRRYVGDDVLRRVLQVNGFEVLQVMNITDVGHLVSDADEGEDKMEKGARKLGKSVWEVAKLFEEQFFKSIDLLNIQRPQVVSRATEHIEDQINLVKRLEEKGFTYKTESAVYFAVSKADDYTKLSGQKLDEKKVGAREDVVVDKEKKNPVDFALWVFTVGRHKDHTMRWESPWGTGFPGWHIECSAMSMKYLGESFDIHTGGIDHIPVHHTNEIAQSESATGKPFAKYWVHHNFLKINNQKMSKSLENLFTISDLVDKGFDPLALRYLFLTAHYRDSLNFTWESLEAAQNALNKLRDQVIFLKSQKTRTKLSKEKDAKIEKFSQKFSEAINDDLNTPTALAVMWNALKSNIPSEDKYDLLMSFDEVLGLKLSEVKYVENEIPKEVAVLVSEREKLRKAGKFEESDKARKAILERGYTIEDAVDGPRVKKIS